MRLCHLRNRKLGRLEVMGSLDSELELLAFVCAHSEAGVVACGNCLSILGPNSFVSKTRRPSLHEAGEILSSSMRYSFDNDRVIRNKPEMVTELEMGIRGTRSGYLGSGANVPVSCTIR